MIFLEEAEIAAAVQKLHIDITDIKAVETLAFHFMIVDGLYLLSNKASLKHRLAGEIEQFLGQAQNMQVAK
ncbi:hypothetical protein DBY68_016630 [Pseudocitrobacter sp. RIT415]|uniref:hypothetical protein n=1 Tax=Pseudocitrobacter sp. RIT415 TaxID=2202163 RepID=UPI000D3B811D|nr:hypothetical protein [Pseudocitrobacter sp. RIT 415]RAU45246.1 hypothetical protein DBY68_016630 [Pseudocitrobacter sp. RIT 415]